MKKLKRKGLAGRIPALLLLLLLLSTSGCGKAGEAENSENGTMVAGAEAESLYAYIREINGQARTVMLDEVELIPRTEKNRTSLLRLSDSVQLYGDSYVYNDRLQQRLYPLAEGLLLDLQEEQKQDRGSSHAAENEAAADSSLGSGSKTAEAAKSPASAGNGPSAETAQLGNAVEKRDQKWDDSSFERGIESIRKGIEAEPRSLFFVRISQGKVIQIKRLH
ncbi:MAG: hypothetical protein Q4B50_06625 [Bacillota bacterium]|nr:hypothetical protein [Bacillota bacterium]